MAYSYKKHTKISYNASGFISYQRIQPNKIYYMPDVIDEASNYWTINAFNPAGNKVVFSLDEYEIRTGYRVLITERVIDSISKYYIHIFDTENKLVLRLNVDSSEYKVNYLRFVNSALILPVAVPNKPSGLTASPISKDKIRLNWTDNSGNEASFAIQRSNDGVSWSEVAMVNENVSSYLDTGLSPITSYQYRVIARNAYGDSSPTKKYTAITLPNVPAAPSNLIIKNVSQTQVELNWLDNSNDEDGYVVQRSLDAANWTTIATLRTPNVESYINSGLIAGTKYYYRVYAYNTGGNSESIDESVTTLRNAPSAPSGLSSMVSGLNITLTWSDNSGNEDGFKIERSLYGSKVFQQVGTASSNATLYEDLNLESGTQYEYRIRAYNEGGNSTYSNTISATTMAAPNAPTNLAGTAVTESRIDISWNDNSLDETIFKVERSNDSGATWTQIATTFADEPSYKDYSVTTGTTYSYRVRAYNSVGNSTYSNTISLAPLSAPVAPSDLVATTVSNSSISISWTDNSDNEVGFKLQRTTDSSNASSWGTIHTAQAGETSYIDTGLNGSTTYSYRIFAYNDIGNSSYSNKSDAKTYPNAPSGLSAIASGISIAITWTDNSTDETGFKLERSVDNKNWTQIAVIAADTSFYGDTGLSPGTTYYYRVRAYTDAANSSYSSTANATTLALPDAPLYLSSNTLSSTEITISWTDNSSNETGFKIERSPNGVSSWVQIATVSANVTSYANTGLTPETSYYYRVRAYNAAGNSDYSNIDSGLTLQAPPATPIDFDIVVLSTSSVKLTWTDVATDETGFVIQRSTNSGVTWFTREVKTPNLNQFTDTGLALGTYSYRVFARNPGGDSEPTKTIEVTL